MPTISDTAVVMQRLDYSETSQIIVFFTQSHGKVRTIGKGIKRGTRKRFAVGIDLLDVGQLVLSSRGERSQKLAHIVEWKQTRSLFGLREKLSRLYGGQYIVEVTGQLTEDWDPHAELFDALIATLAELCDASEVLGPIVRYQLQLLESVGSLPRFSVCVLCGRAADLSFFSSFEGGTICRNCEAGQIEKRELSATTLAVLAGDESSGRFTGAFDVLNYHISHLMGREPRLAAKIVDPARRRIVE